MDFPALWFQVKNKPVGVYPDSHSNTSAPLEDNGDDIQPAQSQRLQKDHYQMHQQNSCQEIISTLYILT